MGPAETADRLVNVRDSETGEVLPFGSEAWSAGQAEVLADLLGITVGQVLDMEKKAAVAIEHPVLSDRLSANRRTGTDEGGSLT